MLGEAVRETGGVGVGGVLGLALGAASPGPITSRTRARFVLLSPLIEGATFLVPVTLQPMLHLKIGRQTTEKAQLFGKRHSIIIGYV